MPTDTAPLTTNQIQTAVSEVVGNSPVWDLHTHLFSPRFGTSLGVGTDTDSSGLMHWGIDQLLTYHYLIAELFRALPPSELSYDKFWSLDKAGQADLIWEELFCKRSPIGESCRGVVTTLSKLGLDPNEPNLAGYRKWFAEQDPDKHVDRVMELSGVERITMTNDVFDDAERPLWIDKPEVGGDSRFVGVLRFDQLVIDWPSASAKLREWGYEVEPQGFTRKTIDEGRRFLREWMDRVGAAYCAVSLPPEFRYPANIEKDNLATDNALAGEQALRKIIIPACTERDTPFAMMIGVTRGINPALRMAGDTVGPADVRSVARLCDDHPDQKFLCTMLARENQHELIVTGRKFRNLMPFGCWWFLNTPSLIEELTRMRVELLGSSFIPQHSDARVLEQILYKWDHSRQVIAKVLTEKYQDLSATGWQVTREAIEKDVRDFFWSHTESWLA